MANKPSVAFSGYCQRVKTAQMVKIQILLGNKTMRRPILLRLCAVVEWRKTRWERAVERGDGTAIRAAELYTEVTARANAVAGGGISTYRD